MSFFLTIFTVWFISGISSVPSLIQLIFFFFLPESPRWLIQKGRYDEAHKSLAKFRSNTQKEDIDFEFNSIVDNCLTSQRVEPAPSISRILHTPSIRRALFIGSLLMMFQQLAGINTVMYYSATIIQMSGVHDKATAVWLSAATSSINFIFSFVGILLVERLGRRLLTLSSLLGVVLALLLLGIGFNLSENNSPPVTFHTPNQSICSTVNTCNQCVESHCGFCFFETPANNFSNNSLGNVVSDFFISKLNKGSVNGTCLVIDQIDPLHSNSMLIFR